MFRSAASKVMWVGRAMVFMVGLAVVLAVVLGAATTALGATGGQLHPGTAQLRRCANHPDMDGQHRHN